MAKASLTIAISGSYNGRAIEKARQDLEKMRIVAVSELGGTGSALINLGSGLAELGGGLHNMGYQMEQVGRKATAGMTLPILAAAAAVGAAAIDMDTSLTGVKKTVEGTEEQYQALKDAAVEFSGTNAVSASQIMDIQSLGAQLGFAIDELDEFGAVVSGLDIATNMDAEQAGTEMAQFANITKMAHSEVSNYGSAIVGLGNNMATTEADISHMAMRLAAAGTQVGMSQADILGLAAALSSMGIEAEAGGTAISTIISQIDKDIATGSESVETWAAAAGMSAQAFADAWKNDPVQALTVLLSSMERATAEGGNMSVMLEELGIDSIRQTDIMKRLAGNSDLVAKAVALSNEEWERNMALQDEVDNRNSSMAAKLQILQNRVVAIAEKFGTPLVNALLDVVDAAEPLIEAASDIAQAFADMDEEDQRMILGLVGAAAAFGPVMTVAGKLTQGIGNLVVGVGKGAQTLGLLQSELGTVKEAFALVRGGAGTAAEGLGMVASSTSVVSGALGVLKTAMLGIGIGAAIAAIGAVVLAIKDVIDHERKVIDATHGLETAMGAAADAYGSYATGVGTAAESLGDINSRTEEVIESQGRLAQSMAEQWADYGSNAALVDAYAREIQELTQKYDEQGMRLQLTAEEQQRLKLAVEGFNEATGASVQITDALNGVLDTSTDAIYASTEAFKEQARAQAAIEMYKDLYRQQLEDEMALSAATDELNRLLELQDEAWATSITGINPYTSQVEEAQRNVDDLTAALQSNSATQEQLLGVIMATGQQFESFDAALESSGIALEDFGDVTDVQLEAIRSSFDGSLSSIVRACNEQGIEIPASLASAISANRGAVNEAAAGLGADIDAGIAAGIESSADRPLGSARSVGQNILEDFAGCFEISSPSRVMEEMGADIDLGLAIGIEGGKDGPVSAISSLGDLIRSSIEGLPDWMLALGSDAGSLLSSGLSSLSGAAQSAGAALSGSAQTGASPAVGALGGIGGQAAGSFSKAIGSASAYGQGQSLARTAKSGLGSISAYGAGQNFAWGFSSGMGSVNIWGAAYSIGRSALGAIKSALGIASPSKEAAKVGAWFGEGAIAGMKSTEAGIIAESRRMADAMILNLSPGHTSPPAAAYGSADAHGPRYGGIGSTVINNNYYIDGDMVAPDAQLAAALGVVAERVSARRRMGTVRQHGMG